MFGYDDELVRVTVTRFTLKLTDEDLTTNVRVPCSNLLFFFAELFDALDSFGVMTSVRRS